MIYETKQSNAAAARHALRRLLHVPELRNANEATQELLEHCRHILAAPTEPPPPRVSKAALGVLGAALAAASVFFIQQLLKLCQNAF